MRLSWTLPGWVSLRNTMRNVAWISRRFFSICRFVFPL
jgi:hypothetical protein